MMKKIIIIFSIQVAIFSSFIPGICQYSDSSSGGNVTQDYINGDLLNKTISGRIAATELSCAGYPTDPFMPGMFQYDGDLESFVTASRGSSTQCVGTNYTTTHFRAPFQDNTCLASAWKVSHGTPEVGVNQNNHFMHIWAGNWTNDGDFEGEGLFYDCELFACLNYNISLRLSSTSTIDKIYFYIASGLQHKEKDGNEWNPESSFYKVPSVTSAYLVHTITNFNSGANTWVNISLPTFAPPEFGMKLWIFSEDGKANVGQVGSDLLFIDDLTDGLPGSSSTCTGNIDYSSSPIPAFSKASTITASVGATLASTEFVGGSSITLSPGFDTPSNSIFRAHIVPCTTGNNCPVPCETCRTAGEAVEVPLVENIIQIEGNDFHRLSIYPNPSRGIMSVDKPIGEKVISVSLIEESTWREIGFNQFEDLDTSIKFSVDSSFKGVIILLLKTNNRVYAARAIVD